jgi:cytochrome c
MKHNLAILATLATALLAPPALAEGDAAKGEAGFKQCQTCHSVVDGAGEVLAGKGAKIGPNLFGVFGRQIGSLEGFKYGDSIMAVGATGLTWDEAAFVKYVQDPGAFLKETLGDKGAKTKMAFKIKNADAAADVYAYLSQFSPAAAPADAAATTTTP